MCTWPRFTHPCALETPPKGEMVCKTPLHHPSPSLCLLPFFPFFPCFCDVSNVQQNTVDLFIYSSTSYVITLHRTIPNHTICLSLHNRQIWKEGSSTGLGLEKRKQGNYHQFVPAATTRYCTSMHDPCRANVGCHEQSLWGTI